ncbi:MAG TPA: T9SS type A sorting domain-containing protein [Saprospiraceae bacterium]|nr:T9SS type A sorting domain-containing protein [Saprospiraceae bacterium]
MKKIVLLILSVFSLGFVFGQVQMQSSVTDTTINVNTFDFEVDVTVSNLAKSAVNLTWTRTIISLPKQWNNYICSGLNCYPPDKSSGPFSIPAGKTSPLYVHFSPNQLIGAAIVIITVTDDADPSNTVSTTYNVAASGSVATNNVIAANSISLYPNPTVNYFMIQNKSNVSKVLLSNLVGKQVKSFNNNQDKFDVADLVGGMYIVQLLDNRNKVIKTSRLSILRP